MAPPKEPQGTSTAADLSAWLYFIAAQYPNGPRLHPKPVAYVNNAAKKKAEYHEYQVPEKDKHGTTIHNADGSVKMRTAWAGGLDDSQEFDTISAFTNHATEGKDLQVALFTHSIALASAPAGHNNFSIRPNKISDQHAWVAVIAKRQGNPKALYIFDSDVLNHPIYIGKGKEQVVKGRKELLNTRQFQLHQYISKRSIRDVFLCSIGAADDKCVFHCVAFIKALMARGDGPVQDEENLFKEFIHLTAA
jgi:hypothetical protein